MQDGNVIEVKDIYKSFRCYHDKSHVLKERLLHWKRNQYEEHQVLEGISFSIKKGEAVGFIGCNGCGKSTILKLLTRIIYPDSGEIQIRGRISSLLELGAGFHPDLNGYENIYLNAAVFGLTRKEIDRRVDEIVRFSELKASMLNPVRTYSSGMYMKLAFSIAINVDADILLIDEILGVGDVSFQKKCFQKLMDIKYQGTTIVLVSHSTDQVEKICDRSIWIAEGKVREEGTPTQVHRHYLTMMENQRLLRQEQEERERRRAEKDAKGRTGAGKEEWSNPNSHHLQAIKAQEELQREADGVQPARQEIERLKSVIRNNNLEMERLNSVIRHTESEKQRILEENERLTDILLRKERISQ